MKKNVLKSKALFLAKYCLSVIAMVLGFALVLCPVSCRLTEEGIEIVPGDKTCPKQEGFQVTGNNSVVITFSEKILLSQVALKNLDDSELCGEAVEINYDETGTSAEIIFDGSTSVGKKYVVSAVATDLSGNTTDVGIGFVGYNANPALIIINEIRTKYDASKALSDFIEFYVLKGGNTYGYKLMGAQKGTDYDYEFPSMEVQSGEYIVLHSKQYGSDSGFVNETEEDLTLSTANESCNTARDLWRDGTDNVFTNNDVIVLMNEGIQKPTDGILLYEFKGAGWSKNLQKEYAALLYENEIWADGSSADFAVNSAGASTIYRSISRKNLQQLIQDYEAGKIKHGVSVADDWAITEKKTVEKVIIPGATPGFENSEVYLK